jgi:quinol monooxygenase YgiN
MTSKSAPAARQWGKEAAMARTLLGLTLLAAGLTLAPAAARATDDLIMVIVHFHPTPGREDELKGRLVKLRDFVNANAPGVAYTLYRSRTEPTVFLLHETFASQAALDAQTRTVFPAFQREHGPIPTGIVTRPVEPERYREVRE